MTLASKAFEASMRAFGQAKNMIHIMASEPAVTGVGMPAPDRSDALLTDAGVGTGGTQREQVTGAAPICTGTGVGGGQGDLRHDLDGLRAPLKVKARGRATSARLKSGTDYYGAKRLKTRSLSDCYETDDTAAVQDLAAVAAVQRRQARCGLCNKGTTVKHASGIRSVGRPVKSPSQRKLDRLFNWRE